MSGAPKLPTIAEARRFGESIGADRVIILCEFSNGQVGCTSWGRTKALCDITRRMADKAFDAVWPGARETER